MRIEDTKNSYFPEDPQSIPRSTLPTFPMSTLLPSSLTWCYWCHCLIIGLIITEFSNQEQVQVDRYLICGLGIEAATHLFQTTSFPNAQGHRKSQY
jgi:hypothetical protein